MSFAIGSPRFLPVERLQSREKRFTVWGGVGKTRLAVEYAWRYAAEHSALLFVGAQSPAELRRNLAALCERNILDLPQKNAKEEEIRGAAALGWLREHSGWLLILDNVDSEDAASAVDVYIARLYGGQVLLTGRLARWSAEVEPIELDVLAEGDAVMFLLERTNKRRRKTKVDDARAAELACELGFLPLALEQAGAYIAERRLTLNAYLEEWKSRRDPVLAWFDPRVSHYPASVAVTWQTSFDRLNSSARRLLERLAWFGPEPIPETLLDVPVPGLEDANPQSRDALVELETYSLVTLASESPTFTIHRLVQDVARRSQGAETIALSEALEWMSAAFVGEPQDVRSWSTLNPLVPHARAVAIFADQGGIANSVARLMNQLAILLWEKALHLEAESLMRRALAIYEKSNGPNHPSVAFPLMNLVHFLLEGGRLDEAEKMARRALEIDETSYGPNHLEVAKDLFGMAQILQISNRLAEAESLIVRAVAICEDNLGQDHPNVSIGLSNLATILMATNRFAEAETLMRRALVIAETSSGANHPDVALRLNNLAQLFQATNRLDEAEPLMRRALAIDESSYGPDHPRVAIRLNNLGALMHATSRSTEGDPFVRRALAIDETTYGSDHPNVARDLNNLAQLFKTTNRLSESEPLLRRALAIFLGFARRTGHEHPNLRVARANYAGLLEEMGRSPAEVEAAIQSLTALPDP